MDNYFKKGAYVIYHYKEWQEVLWSNSGWGWVSKWKHAVMLENPRDEYGRFTTNFKYESDVTVKLMDEDGKVFKATLEDIERDVDPATLNEDDFKKIYREIARGSIFYSDYTNSLGVFQNTLYDYYEGFLEELADRFGNEEEARKNDTYEEFCWYCQGIEYLRPVKAA